MLTRQVIRNAVEAALAEDAPNGDITCETTIPTQAQGEARLTAREQGVMSGVDVFAAAFAAQNPTIEVTPHIADGERFESGQALATVRGPVRDLLTAERVALNFTQRMSGIATMTSAFVNAVAQAEQLPGYRAPHAYARTRIVDTRKTTPGLRAFEKYAVVCGGGHNHRYGLSDAVMVKDNHVAALAEQGIDLSGAIRHIREQVGHTTHIEVEVDRLDQIPQALAGGADTILPGRHPQGSGSDRRACDRGGQRHHDIGTGFLGRGHGRGRDLRRRLDAQRAQHRLGIGLGVMSTGKTQGELYLDAASTEPVRRSVIEAMMPFLTDAYANPLSVHQPGKTAARALGAARASLAADLGARPDDVIFTSGGTESDNLAIKGIAMARMRALREKYGESVRPRVIISAIEHPAVAQSAQWLEQWFGVEVVRIPVDGQAHIDTAALERELAQGDLEPAPGNKADRHTDSGSSIDLTNRTLLVSVMLANNEVGTIEPADEIARIAHRHGVPVHVDAVQAAGQIPIRMRDWNVDALSISGHKFGTPKGLGALLLRGRVPIEPLLSGGGQERGLRSGTQNVAGAVALAIALRESNERMASQCRALVSSRDRLIDAVLRVEPKAMLTGDAERRLPGHASFLFPGLTGEALLVDLDAHGIACSSGSACALGRHEAPGTLLAMGFDESVAKSALRMTFREPLQPDQINRVAAAVEESCHSLTHTFATPFAGSTDAR